MVPWQGIRVGVGFGLSERVEKNFLEISVRLKLVPLGPARHCHNAPAAMQPSLSHSLFSISSYGSGCFLIACASLGFSID